MNSLLDDLDDDERGRNDREVTLSTGTILGIFFGLAMLCGLFFGFGYKLGSHKATLPVEAATTTNPAEPSSTFSDFKPAAGSPEGGSAAMSPSAATPASAEDNAADAPDTSDTNSSGDAEGGAEPKAAVARESARASRRAASAAPSAAAPEIAGTGDIFVQVAAVSHQEDANLLVNALRSKGYPVSAHAQPQDKFFHIQVGPFDSLKDAQATKQRLLADGYQPIIK